MKFLGLGSMLRTGLGRGMIAGGIAAFMAIGLTTPSLAQDEGAVSSDKPAVNAVTGSAWQGEVTPAEGNTGADGSLPQEQLAIIERINAYLLTFSDLKGQFVQTNPDSVMQKGTFYFLRPGRMRFDYARPSKMRIVCDGSYLSIEDHDMKTVNRYPIESTPFKMLLVKDVKLQRDARILSVSSSDASATVTLADKTGQSAGQIQLFFAMPEIELKEWVITDAQGLNTRIEVSNLEKNLNLDPKLFSSSQVGLAKVFGDKGLVGGTR